MSRTIRRKSKKYRLNDIWPVDINWFKCVENGKWVHEYCFLTRIEREDKLNSWKSKERRDKYRNTKSGLKEHSNTLSRRFAAKEIQRYTKYAEDDVFSDNTKYLYMLQWVYD